MAIAKKTPSEKKEAKSTKESKSSKSAIASDMDESIVISSKKPTVKKSPSSKSTSVLTDEEVFSEAISPIDETSEVKVSGTKKSAKAKDDCNVDVYVEFGGARVSVDEVIKNVKITRGEPAQDYQIYIKPDEHKAYYVADGEEGVMDVYFVG